MPQQCDADAINGQGFVKISPAPHEVFYKERIKNPCGLDICDNNQLIDIFFNQANRYTEAFFKVAALSGKDERQ